MKNQKRTVSNQSKALEKSLRSLVNAPQTACRIYEFAESLFWRDETAERMTFADIARVHEFLRETEQESKRIKKQFQDLVEIDGDFQTEKIPIGF